MTKNANSLPDCDCLSYCGDDPRIDKGRAAPCLSYRRNLARRRLENAAPELLAALQTLLNDQRDASLPALVQAREAIFNATGAHTT
jgi:hypothetical protein